MPISARCGWSLLQPFSARKSAIDPEDKRFDFQGSLYVRFYDVENPVGLAQLSSEGVRSFGWLPPSEPVVVGFVRSTLNV